MDKILNMLGLAKKAGKVTTGEFLSEKSIKSGESKLIIIACDTSDRGKKSITDACKYYNVEYIEYADKESLGRITGSKARAVVSVNDSGFKEAILKKLS